MCRMHMCVRTCRVVKMCVCEHVHTHVTKCEHMFQGVRVNMCVDVLQCT